MLQLDTRSNRFIATIGTGVALLLALNLGILVHSHFLMPPYNAAQIITYFLTFSSAIIFTIYKTVDILDEPNMKYVEGLVIGTFGSVAVLLYLPSVFFEPTAEMFQGAFPFFAVSYLVAVGLTAILVTGVVKGSELYCVSEKESELVEPEDEGKILDEDKETENESDSMSANDNQDSEERGTTSNQPNVSDSTEEMDSPSDSVDDKQSEEKNQ